MARSLVQFDKTSETLRHFKKFIDVNDWTMTSKFMRHSDNLSFITNAYFVHLSGEEEPQVDQKDDWEEGLKAFEVLKNGFKLFETNEGMRQSVTHDGKRVES